MAISDWLETHVDDRIKYTGNGKEAHFNCVVCSDTRHRMYVNLETGEVYCHNCGYKSSILGLIQVVEGVEFSKAHSIFEGIKGNLTLPEKISRNNINEVFMGNLKNTLDKRPIPLPEEYCRLDPNHTNIVTKRAINYLHSRKITDKQIVDHNMGFCMSGEYKNRVIIPVTGQNNQLMFWVARAISKDVKMKEKSPSNTDYQISKSEVVFNLDKAARKYHSIVICEGIFDALAYGDIGVSLLGKSLYQEQLNLLLDYRELLTEGVFVSLDWDARDKATEIAKTLSQYFTVYIVNIPKELDDPNNSLQQMGKSYMNELLVNAEQYEEFSSLKRLFT